MSKLLPIYGIFRIILGIAQIVGLTTGFFITEMVVRYPQGSLSFVFDQDILALVYLAVMIRAIFHLVSGIGIAKCFVWAAGWLRYGWMIVILIVGGLLYTQFSHWVEIGLMKNLSDAVSWPKLGIYLCWIIFDYTVIIPSLEKPVDAQSVRVNPMEGNQLGWVILGSTAFFVILLFLGKPIKQGFHQGYYRIHEAAPQEAGQERLEEKLEAMEKKINGPNASVEQLTTKKKEDLEKHLLKDAEDVSKKQAVQPPAADHPEDMSYRQMMGYVGALGVIVGLCLQVIFVYNRRENGLFIYAYILQASGYFLFLFFSLSERIMPGVVLSLFAFILINVMAAILWFFKRS